MRLALVLLPALMGCQPSVAYSNGYEDGCEVGAGLGGFLARNDGCDIAAMEAGLEELEADGDYQRGRLDGYEECFLAHCEIQLNF
jgi:hypothetical protein